MKILILVVEMFAENVTHYVVFVTINCVGLKLAKQTRHSWCFFKNCEQLGKFQTALTQKTTNTETEIYEHVQEMTIHYFEPSHLPT